MKFTISQFYPCSEVKVGSELFYLCELGKYLQLSGHVLSFDGITISDTARKSKYWMYLKVAYMNGWVVDIKDYQELESLTLCDVEVKNIEITEDLVPYDSEDNKKRQSDFEYDILTPKKRQVVFQSKSEALWVFDQCDSSSDNSLNLNSLKDDLVSQSWVSMVAYIAVSRVVNGYPQAFSLVLSETYTMCSLSFADMTILLDETDALNGWCFTDIGSDTRFSYEAWWFKYKDLGYLNRYYNPQEKLAEFKNFGYYKGDVVFLYERNTKQQLNRVKSVISCNFAIIKDVTESGLVLDVFYSRNTRFGEQVKFNSYPEVLRSMYKDESFKGCRHSKQTIDWLDLGVEYFLYDEKFFISSIDKLDTLEIQDMTTDLKEKTYSLDCINAIYWLLCDHSILFDKESYISKYFRGGKPMYELFKEGKLK